MTVSVIIPAYNAERFVAEAIESVLAQTLAPQEIIVVDDGSTDGTAAVVNQYGSTIRYLRQANAGAAAARNAGVAASVGEFIAFLDADDVWNLAFLEKVMARFLQRPDCGLVFTGSRSVRPPSDQVWVRADPLPKDFVRRYHFAGVWSVGPPITVIRRRIFDSLGGFDESLSRCEDQDLYLRAMLAVPFEYIAEPLVTVRRFGQSLTSNIDMLWRANKQFYAKHRHTFGSGLGTWLLWHRAKSNCRRAHAWAYVMRGQRGRAALAGLQASLIWPFDQPFDWVRLWANVLCGSWPSRARRMLQGLISPSET